METIDLFQHRIDAWATGLAYRRLVKRRRAGRGGLVGGYWGLLGRLRPIRSPGALMGICRRRVRIKPPPRRFCAPLIYAISDTGAFAIGLDSARVRRGLKLLDMLQAGISPSEALGYIAERKLHDRQQDILIFRLRDLFPLRDPRDDAAIETRLSDGLSSWMPTLDAMVPPAEVAPLRALQDDLHRSSTRSRTSCWPRRRTCARWAGRMPPMRGCRCCRARRSPVFPVCCVHVVPVMDRPTASSFSSIPSSRKPTPRHARSPNRRWRRWRHAVLQGFDQAFVEVTIPGGADGSRHRNTTVQACRRSRTRPDRRSDRRRKRGRAARATPAHTLSGVMMPPRRRSSGRSRSRHHHVHQPDASGDGSTSTLAAERSQLDQQCSRIRRAVTQGRDAGTEGSLCRCRPRDQAHR